jgi:hypothetical protein
LPSDDLNEIIGPMAKGKTQMEKAASYIKERYKINTPPYDETEKKYNMVQADYNGWLAQLKLYISQGKKDIKPVIEEFEPISKEVEGFVKYVYALTPTTKSKISVMGVSIDLEGIVGAALKLWDAYKKSKEEGRKKIIAIIDTQAWKDFKEI